MEALRVSKKKNNQLTFWAEKLILCRIPLVTIIQPQIKNFSKQIGETNEKRDLLIV